MTAHGLLSAPRTFKVAGHLNRIHSRANSMFMSANSFSVGIVGATGAVGEETLKLYASEKSAGKTITSPSYGTLTLEEFSFESASKLDVIFLAVGGDFSLEWAEKLANAGVLVIDNSSAFRYKDDIPLVIPEINISAAKNKKLIANPNCTTGSYNSILIPCYVL